MKIFRKILITTACFFWVLMFQGCERKKAIDSHAEHSEHSEHDEHDEHDEHAGHTEHEVAESEEYLHLELNPESIRLAGIQIDTARIGSFRRNIRIPGEVKFNEDKLAHVSPRFEGTVKAVKANIGNHVLAGAPIASVESNASLESYSIYSPISGTVVEKHITTGEFVSQDSRLFTIVDLKNVWIDMHVPDEKADLIKSGMEVEIQNLATGLIITAKIDYTSPYYGADTRSGLVRVVLPNPNGKWRPGTFVTGRIMVELDSAAVFVPQGAVQLLGEQTIVFQPVKTGVYRPVPVKTGISNRIQTEIISGLLPGESYVSEGAFELKAKIALRSLGEHAGHGH